MYVIFNIFYLRYFMLFSIEERLQMAYTLRDCYLVVFIEESWFFDGRSLL